MQNNSARSSILALGQVQPVLPKAHEGKVGFTATQMQAAACQDSFNTKPEALLRFALKLSDRPSLPSRFKEG